MFQCLWYELSHTIIRLLLQPKKSLFIYIDSLYKYEKDLFGHTVCYIYLFKTLKAYRVGFGVGTCGRGLLAQDQLAGLNITGSHAVSNQTHFFPFSLSEQKFEKTYSLISDYQYIAEPNIGNNFVLLVNRTIMDSLPRDQMT